MGKSVFVLLFLALAIPFETSIVYNNIVNIAMIAIIFVGFLNFKNVIDFYKIRIYKIITVFLIITFLISLLDLIMYGYETKLVSFTGFIFLFLASAIIFHSSQTFNSMYYGYITGIVILIFFGYKYILLIITTDSGILELENFDGKNSSFNSNTLAINFNLTAIFLFFFFFNSKKVFLKYLFLFLGIGLLALSLQTTGSKKGLVLMMLIIIWLLYNIIKQNKKKMVRIIVPLIVLVYGGIIYFINYFQDTQTFNRFSNFLDPMSKDNNSGSSYHRRTLMREGLQFWEDKPVFGNGLGSFPSLTSTQWGYSHNNYVEILLSVGFIGFLFFYGIYFLILRGYIKLVIQRKSDILVSMNLLLISGILITEFANITYYATTHAVLLAYLLTTLVRKQNEDPLRNR